ncbi:hypothetical protein SAMN05421831_104118 [Allopseudospirillum japonicum]|uniref:Uncharacterized protein n=1 Tax=Allopseudospirillum japonicum TaxID=64971 RepID=A0A1H6RKZ5_9GAMM|nr:hypothetical protein [Allopseudospirillum japonicum]SEI56449.1 hypothetical protein SAMN05421831_104118 [Allopseudospirillum japonicum]
MKQAPHYLIQTLFSIFCLLLYPFSKEVQASGSDLGLVVRENVCAQGNLVIKTREGWFVGAQHAQGAYFYVGDVVTGTLTKEGTASVYQRGRDFVGQYRLLETQLSLRDAIYQVCDQVRLEISHAENS